MRLCTKAFWKNRGAFALSAFALTCPASSQAPPAPPAKTWSNVTTLSYVSASGNSSIETVGFSDDFIKKWDMMSLTVKSGMIRSRATTSVFAATGTSLDDVLVLESRVSSVMAENYFLNARFDYRLKDTHRWYWYGGTSWDRNVPIGLDSRIAVTSGMGRIVADSEKTKLRVDVGAGLTREEPVVRPADYRRDFVTFNITGDFTRQMGPGVTYGANLASASNMRQSHDWLLTLKQGLTVAMYKGTALKVGLDMYYRNRPALIAVRAFTLDDPPADLGDVVFRAKKLDTVATTSLVITF